MVAVEAGGEDLFLGRIGQEVSRHLPGDEGVERKIAVVGADDPVAPGAHVAVLIIQVSVTVGEAGDIQPVGSHALAVMCGGEVAVDQLFIRVGRLVTYEAIDLCE